MPRDFWIIVSNSTTTQTRVCLRTLFRLEVSRINGRETVNRQNKVTTPIETGVSKNDKKPTCNYNTSKKKSPVIGRRS